MFFQYGLGRRNVGFENGVLCRTPPFLLPFFDPAVPTCTGAASNQAAESTPAPVASSVASVAPAPPVTSAPVVVETTPAPPPLAPTTVVKTIIPPATTVVETATVVPVTSAPPVISSVIVSSIKSIPPSSAVPPPVISPAVPPPVTSSALPPPVISAVPPISSTSSIIPIPIPISQSSEPSLASTTLATIPSPSIQTTPTEETAAPTSSSPTTSTSSSSFPTQTTPSAISETGSNEIISKPTHLSTDAKVAITTAITLSVLFLIVSFLYLLHRRKRQRLAANQNPFTNNDFVIEGGEVEAGGAGNMDEGRRELGPNGYPLDIKMEDGTLLGSEENRGNNVERATPRGRSPPLMQNPVYDTRDRSRVVSPDGGSTLGEMKSFGPPLMGVATAATSTENTKGTGTSGGKKVDIVTLPMPPRVQVARAVSDSGSMSSQQTREDRINALSMARTLSSAGTSSSLSNHTTPPHGILKNKLSTSSTNPSPAPTPERHQKKKSTGSHRREGSRSRRGSSATHHGRNRSGTVGGVGIGGSEVPLSDASRELSQLTREYDAERKDREREKEGSHRECMNRDRDVRVKSPTLPALDLKAVGADW